MLAFLALQLGDCPYLRLRLKASISCRDRGLSPGPQNYKASISIEPRIRVGTVPICTEMLAFLALQLGDCPHLRLRFKASISCRDRGLSPGPQNYKASISIEPRIRVGTVPICTEMLAFLALQLGDCPHLRLRFKASISCRDRGLSPGPQDYRATI